MNTEQAFRTEGDLGQAGFIGKIRKPIPSIDGFDQALYKSRLYSLYGAFITVDISKAYRILADGKAEVIEEIANRPDYQAAFEIINPINEFIDIAPRITLYSRPGNSVPWPKCTAPVEDIDEAFRVWLTFPDLQKAIRDADNLLKFPNGLEGASPAMLTKENLQKALTPDEQTDPLLLSA
jgi:hypothetical protein